MEDLRQAVGQDLRPLTFTHRLVVNTLDAATAGDVVLGGGELDRPIVGQLHRRLHQPLAVTLDPHHHGTVEVLERTADDLRGGSRLRIDEYRQRNLGVKWLVRSAVDDLLAARIAPTCRHDLLASRDEEVHDLDGLVDESASIVTQVQDEPTQLVLGLQLKEGFLHLRSSGIGEACQGDVAHILPYDAVVGDRADLNLLTAELHTAGLRFSRSLDEERDLTARRPLERSTHLIARRLTEVLAIDLEDDIPGT